MELKHFFLYQSFARLNGLNRTFMELKRRTHADHQHCSARLNRTFMELKHQCGCKGETCRDSLNRTFMELKRCV